MKPQAFQPGELRDEYDQIIRAGAYGKKTPFVNSDNNAILDYIMNNFDALYAQIPNGRAYVKSVNNITPDSNGNVTVNVGSGGGTGGTNITVDTTLSSTSTNPVQNKAIYAALNNKLDKNGTATYAARDSSGNIISSTYARKTELSGYVKSINNVKPDSAGNVNISTGGGGTGTNITVDSTLSSTSTNPIANKAVYAAVNNKLDKTGIAAYATRDSSGNVIINTYATKNELSGCVKSINNITPDSNGNVTITVSGGTGGNITVDSALSSTSTNAIQNRVVQQEFTSVRAAIPTKVSQLTNDSGYLTQHQSLDGYVKTSGQNVWRAQQTFNLATLGYEQYTTPNSSTSSVSPSTSAASYYATGAFTLNLATLSALLGSNQSTVFTAYITAGGDYALSITNGGTVKYIGEASDVAITSAGLLLNILMTKDSYGSLTSIVQANKLT